MKANYWNTQLLMRWLKRGAATGAMTAIGLTVILEGFTGGRFVGFLAMIMGIYACGIDGYGGFFQDCGGSHATMYLMAIVLFLIVGLFAGVLASILLWLFSLMRHSR